MSLKKIFKILLLTNIIFQVILEDGINYDKKEIEDMRISFLSGKDESFYYLGDNLIEDNHKIIAFADLDGDKLTDIITYQKEENKYTFYYFKYTKKSEDQDEKAKFIKNGPLFSLDVSENETIRNLYVGRLFIEKNNACYLVSFNNKDDTLSHYIRCSDNPEENIKLDITSNILIMNKDFDEKVKILFYEKGNKRKICKLNFNQKENGFCDYIDFEEILDKSCYSNDGHKYVKDNISLKGGLAYVDIDGNCAPDIILTQDPDNSDERLIEIYTTKREDKNQYCLTQVIHLSNRTKLGAFAITKVNDEKSESVAPMLDILIPYIDENKIKIFKNKKEIEYSWSDDYCNYIYEKKKDEFKYGENNVNLFEEKETEILSISKYGNLTMDSTFTTVIRVGDFLESSNPGILLKQNIIDKNTSIISLFKRENNKFVHYDSIEKKINGFLENDDFEMGLFFDIDEAGTLSLIISTKKGKNYFFFNYRRNVYFIKSKLMNHKKDLYDANLGATFRYIVTNKKGDRHMDVSHQLSQTSDTNIPLPYCLIGLDDTNNYVEYFQTISGNYLGENEEIFANSDEKDWKTNSPIIPNTQMMISKYFNDEKKIEWNVDLIVQPMDKIWLFLIVVIIVLIIVLVIIIILHFKEVKEEQKETNKFKSWFA